MRLRATEIVFVLITGGIACGLVGCGQSQSESAKASGPVIRGDPIDPTPKVSPPPATPPAVPVAATSVPLIAVQTSSAPSTTQSPATIVATAKEPSPLAETYPLVGFDKLASYNFEVPDGPLTNSTAGPDPENGQIPAAVKAFDDRKVSIKGFMLPLKVQAGSVTEFLILKDQSMCCYGNVPKITEWVSVKTAKGVKAIMDQPVRVEGTLHVGANRENGYLVGIYQMDGDQLIDPEGQ